MRSYDTSTKEGRAALAGRLQVPEGEVLDAVRRAGFTPYTELTDQDLREILRTFEPHSQLSRAWRKVKEHARTEALRRCRKHRAQVRQMRQEAFGQKAPVFAGNLAAARTWLLSLVGITDAEVISGEGEHSSYDFMIWLQGENNAVTLPSAIDRLKESVEWLKRMAAVSRLEALTFILTDDVQADPPVRVTIRGRYGRSPQVVVTAESYVPANLVSYAVSEGVRRATGRERARPGPRRDHVSPLPSIQDLVLAGGVACTELGVAHDAATKEGPFWKSMAPGMDEPPDRYATLYATALETDNGRFFVPDIASCEWDIDPFEDL